MWFIVTYFAIVLLVIEIAVVLMRSTGLKYDIARFQVISLLTSTGFTTKESELVLGHPVRRRLGMFLILFGVFSFAVIISSISSILAPDLRISYLAVIPVVLALLLVVLKLPMTQPLLMNKFNLPLERKFEIYELPINDVLLHCEDDAFLDIPVGPKSSLIGHTLDIRLKGDADVNVLFIGRGTETIRKDRLRTRLESGDILYIYGEKEEIDRAFGKELEDKDGMMKDEIKALSWIGRGG
ncbi:TrkA C-terminal domain-containing protein [Cohnella lupini]|uniref:TrkA family protein n=1 Tax=Cohnella lupini TaxID=1294267 RepID=A0A3D9HYA8_9BACL|nr:TrkA C-terminal domain-containing protein [Cohnella lupini]RED54498.1 TrkA family protein [Cohnella lupini]